MRFSFAATSWSPCGRNDLLFRAFGEGGAWWGRSRHQAPPGYITSCHSERSETTK